MSIQTQDGSQVLLEDGSSLLSEVTVWNSTGLRHSLALLPNPSQGLDNSQVRYSLAGVYLPLNSISGSVTPTLGSFTASIAGTNVDPYDYTLKDRYSAHLIPDPAGWDYQTSLALGGVPGANVQEEVNRDGAIDVSLGAFTTDFDGSFGTGGFNEARRLSVQLIPDPAEPFGALTRGAIGGIPVLEEFTATQGSVLNTTIDGFSASFTGEYTQSDFFDISYSVTPTWVATEQPARFGDVAVTLGSFTTDLDGQALPPDSTQGAISPTLSAFTSSFDGTFAAAAGRTGSFSLDIQNFGMSASGSAVAPGGNTGLVDISVSAFSTNFDGSFSSFSTDGASSYTLDDFSIGLAGNFFDAGTNVGEIGISISSFSGSLRGLTTDLGRIPVRRFIDTADKRLTIDDSDIRLIL